MKTLRHFMMGPVLLAAAGCGGVGSLPIPEVGDAAPSFRLTNVVTNEDVTSDSLKGGIVVLNFWSTTCLVCAKEIEELKQIESEGQAQVVGIAIDDDADKVGKVVKARGINYPVLNGNEEVFTRYDGFNIPYTLVLDSNSRIRKKVFGPMDKDEFAELIESIKNES